MKLTADLENEYIQADARRDLISFAHGNRLPQSDTTTAAGFWTPQERFIGHHLDLVIGAKLDRRLPDGCVHNANFLSTRVQNIGTELVVIVVLPEKTDHFPEFFRVRRHIPPQSRIHFIFRLYSKNNVWLRISIVIILVVHWDPVGFKRALNFNVMP